MAAQETSSTAQMAEGRLWEFQLRKEHAALLRKIEQIGEERNEELRSLRTMMNAGEDLVERDRVKIADLQRRFDELVRVVTEQRARIREFEDGVRSFSKGRVSHEQLGEIMGVGESIEDRRRSDSSSTVYGADDLPRTSIETSFDNTHARPPPRPANRKASNLTSRPLVPPSARPSEFKPHPTGQAKPAITGHALQTANTHLKPMISTGKRPTTTRPTSDVPRPAPMTRSRSRSRGREPEPRPRQIAPAPPPPQAEAPAPPAPVKIPKLSQKHKSLKAYYDATAILYPTLNINDEQSEFDFVGAFIAGLTSKKNKEMLTWGLQQFCMSKNTDEGKTVVECDWNDVRKGFQKAKIDLDGEGNGQGGGKRPTKR